MVRPGVLCSIMHTKAKGLMCMTIGMVRVALLCVDWSQVLGSPLIGMWPATEALACLWLPTERTILKYIGGWATEHEGKYTCNASFDGCDDGYSACG